MDQNEINSSPIDNLNSTIYSRKKTKKVYSTGDLIEPGFSVKSSDIASSSCISFLNRIVDKKLEEESNCPESTHSLSQLEQSFTRYEETFDETQEDNDQELRENKESKGIVLIWLFSIFS